MMSLFSKIGGYVVIRYKSNHLLSILFRISNLAKCTSGNWLISPANNFQKIYFILLNSYIVFHNKIQKVFNLCLVVLVIQHHHTEFPLTTFQASILVYKNILFKGYLDWTSYDTQFVSRSWYTFSIFGIVTIWDTRSRTDIFVHYLSNFF